MRTKNTRCKTRITTKLIVILIVIALTATQLAAFAVADTVSVSFEMSNNLRAWVGQSFSNPATTTAQGAQIVYSSSNPNVATVDNAGNVVSLAVGTTVITATSGNASASFQLRVIPARTGNPTVDAINEMELVPIVTNKWSQSFFDRINGLVSDDMTNHQRMRAVYDDVVRNFDMNRNCVGWAVALQCAFEVIGFRTYHVRGLTRTAAGGWTEHSWVGVDVGGTLYYFDANLPGRHGAPDQYFAVPSHSAPFYRDAFIEQLSIHPESTWFPILATGPISETVSERQHLRSVAGDRNPGFAGMARVG